jgi:cytochrome c peroxidase
VKGLVTVLTLALVLVGTPARAESVEFTAAERARILSHGPWPPPHRLDPANRVDGQPQAIALGRQLFFDTGLSSGGRQACASCHDPRRGFQDGRQTARHGRNTPGLLDAAQQRWFGWDGATDSLWSASLAPLMARDELAATPPSALAYLAGNRKANARFRALFGAPQPDVSVLVNLAKALAAFQTTLVSSRTAFDDFRDALARSDYVATARYPAQARRGLKLFVGEGRCFVCHAGPMFANGEFGDVGRPFFNAGGVDPGRWGGLQLLLDSPYNRLGAFADAGPEHPSAVGTRHVRREPRNYGEFKVPGLRGLVASAPYFHDGSAATLDDVARHYSELDENRIHADGARLLKALRLTPLQAADLVAFLKTLGPPDKASR